MSIPYPINAAVGAAWAKVLDKYDLIRYGHVIGSGADVELAPSATPAADEITFIGQDAPMLYTLVKYQELWARTTGGAGTLGGLLITVAPPGPPGPVGVFDSVAYRGEELDDRYLRGTSGTTGTGGADQRPATPPTGFLFAATDINVGGGAGNGVLLVYFAGVGWKDPANNIIP